MRTRCVYGPVPSRRLGRSLGVDLIPYKVCCYDCVYCQVGKTSDLSVERRAFLDPDEVVRQVEAALREGRPAEGITLSGSGEPTLYRELPALVRGLRRVTELPLQLLTNGGLLWDDEVREAALLFDLVAPSLDAADAETFAAINRPHASIDFQRMWDGLARFCREYRGRCRLEVMLVQGVNDSPTALAALASRAASLDVEVDLNTVVRPPAYPVAPLDDAGLESALAAFAGCRASLIAPFKRDAAASSATRATRERVLETLARRPCTLADLRASLGLAAGEIEAALAAAVDEGLLEEEQRQAGTYYVIRRQPPAPGR